MRWTTDIDERGALISRLLLSYKRDEAMSLVQMDHLEAQLTPAELSHSSDSLVALRSESLRLSGKLVQAYNTLTAGLKKYPTSLGLQTERIILQAKIREVFDELMFRDPLNLEIEHLYEILKREGVLAVESQVRFLEFLIAGRRFNDACRLAVPLVHIAKAALGLRGAVERIVVECPHPTLLEFLKGHPAKIGREHTVYELSHRDAFVLHEKFIELHNSMNTELPVHIIERQLKEIVGADSDAGPIKSGLKEFYWLLARVEDKKENRFAAIEILKGLVELDPASLKYRQYLIQFFANFCEEIKLTLDKERAKFDLAKLVPVLTEIGVVDFKILREYMVLLANGGKPQEARLMAEQLLALNEWDSDYVGCAERVAAAIDDQVWLSDLRLKLKRIAENRPWDLELTMNVEDSTNASSK